jgi:NADH-quinone oxidoreductase subunit N
MTVGLFWLFREPDPAWGLTESVFWGGMMRNDLVTLVFRVMFLSALTLTALLSMDVPRLQKIEYYGLLVTATIGFSLMAASSDLIMIYVALETASISSYLLAGFYSGQTRSSEAGMKYFVYGAFTTAVMLYGMSMLYGVTGQTNLYLIGSLFSNSQQIDVVQPLLLLAAVLSSSALPSRHQSFPTIFGHPTCTRAHRHRLPVSCPRLPRRPVSRYSCVCSWPVFWDPPRLRLSGGPCWWRCVLSP